MDLMKYLAGGAALGVIAGFWEKIKAVLWRLASFFVQRVEVNSEYAEMLEFIERFADLKETPAQFQERCAQQALKCFWREKSAPNVEPARIEEEVWPWQHELATDRV